MINVIDWDNLPQQLELDQAVIFWANLLDRWTKQERWDDVAGLRGAIQEKNGFAILARVDARVEAMG